MLSLFTAWKVVRDLGLPWVAKRTKFAVQARLGLLKRRLPVSKWDFSSREWLSQDAPVDPEEFKRSIAERSRFFDSPTKPPRSLVDGEQVCRRADCLLAGEWPLFSHQWVNLGFPPDWHLNVLDGTQVDQSHWSHIHADRIHDIKFVWEPSRFSPVYLLVRAYGMNHDARYAEGFWRLVEDWAEKNPPNLGANWMSGQEAAFRVIAWCFGLFAFFDCRASTAPRVLKLMRMIEKHGERISGFIEYAISQRNNHGISEAVGLFTIGILFPQLRRAEEWLEAGRELIISQLEEQVYADGSYIQHSFNYQRVMLDDLVWAFRLGELNDHRFSADSYELLARSAKFLLRFCDPKTGRVPNYGGNDGSLVLPLSSCDYADFRPSIQAAYYLSHRQFCFEGGPWNEMVERLFAADTATRTACGPAENIERSSYVKLQARESYGMLRAVRYSDRPAQADQFHFDLWWRGENIACDAGTYLYNGVNPWTNVLSATHVHNTVSVSNRDQMTRAGRFLWLDWAQAGFRSFDVAQLGTGVDARHDGYRAMGVIHRRSVLSVRDIDSYIIVDDIIGDSVTKARLHWLFPDYPFTWDHEASRLVLKTQVGEFQCVMLVPRPYFASIAKGGEVVAGMCSDSEKSNLEVRGWRSLYYGEKESALSLAVETDSRLPVRFVSVLAPAEIAVVHLTATGGTLRSADQDRNFSLAGSGEQYVFHPFNP